jgi:hypothetical protein
MDDQAERIRLLEIQVRSHNLAIRRSELTLRRIAHACLAARESKNFEAAIAEVTEAHNDWVSGKILVDTPLTDAFGKTVIYSHCEKHGPYVRTDENVCPACRRG